MNLLPFCAQEEVRVGAAAETPGGVPIEPTFGLVPAYARFAGPSPGPLKLFPMPPVLHKAPLTALR